MLVTTNWARRWQDRLFGLPSWNADAITDEWFRAHFSYAADVVRDWLDPALDLAKARLMDFGCGDGITGLALVLRHGATAIHGIDIRREYEKLPHLAKAQLGLARLPSALSFETIVANSPLAPRHADYDGILTWSTFEHVDRDKVLPILADLRACLRPGGVLFLQIEPLYYSPMGSHLGRYIDQPWHHLLLDEAQLWQAVASHTGPLPGADVDSGFEDMGSEAYKRYIFREYQALNRLTADELVCHVKEAGFEILREERRHVTQPIPQELTVRYPEEWLRNNEILLLLRKP